MAKAGRAATLPSARIRREEQCTTSIQMEPVSAFAAVSAIVSYSP